MRKAFKEQPATYVFRPFPLLAARGLPTIARGGITRSREAFCCESREATRPRQRYQICAVRGDYVSSGAVFRDDVSSELVSAIGGRGDQ